MTAGNPIKTIVKIDGIDVTTFLLRWEMENSNSALISSISIDFHSLVNSLNPDIPDEAIGLSVEVTRGETTGAENVVFKGFISRIDKEINKVYITARDRLYEAVQRNVTKTFASNIDTEAGKVSEIFKTLINDFTDLTADNSSVDDSGTEIILKRFICNNADVFERCEILAEFLSWQFYYDPTTDKVFFQPEGERTNIGTLTVGTEITENPNWIRDGSKKVKTLKLFGGPQEVETTETFSGDDSETEFELLNLPVSVKAFVDSVLQVGSVEGTVVDADYSVDPTTKTITFVVPPPTAGGNVEIRYSYLSPIALTGQNLIDYGLDLTLRKPDLTTIADVENFATAYLLRHSVDFIRASLPVVDVQDMDAGQTVTVIDVDQNINQLFFIKKIKKQFPYTGDVIEVDSEEIRTEDWNITIDDRLRRIEERLIQEESIVFIIRALTRETVTLERRYLIVEKRNIQEAGIAVYGAVATTYGTAIWAEASGGFILGSETLGVLGTNKLGPPTTLFVRIRVQQGEDSYLEDFHDGDFKDGVTTATWGST